MSQSDTKSLPIQANSDPTIYGAGFASVYGASRYTTYSQYLARLALGLIEKHGVSGGALLDLACGVGAGTAVFARAGYSITAIDGSEVMVACTESRARELNIDLRVSRQDMREFTAPYQVDVITCLFDAMNYLLTDSDMNLALTCVRRALRPDGLFILDLNTPHGLATRWGTKDVVSTNRADLFEVNCNRYNPETQINTTTTSIFVRNRDEAGDTAEGCFRRYTEVHRERGYTAANAGHLLAQAGFQIESIQEVADVPRGGLQPVTDQAGRIMIAARPAATHAVDESSPPARIERTEPCAE